MTSDRPPSARQRADWSRYRRRFLGAVVLLVWADLIGTLGAAGVYGLDAELNPIMRWLLGMDYWIVLLAHASVFALAIFGFQRISCIGRSLTGVWAHRFDRLCLVWIHAMMVVGALVVLNNCALTIVAILP